MSTPRYIRKRNLVVVGYLCRVTEIYTIASVLVLVFGLILTQLLREFSKPWVSASITLYVVAVVLHAAGVTALIWLAILVLMVWGANS